MKKILLLVVFCGWANLAFAVTTFTITVMPSSGDYTSLQSAVSAINSNLTTDVVMSHSGKVGTMADGSAVTGKTSGATGTLMHVTSTQIAIKTVVGTFQSGEQVYTTIDTNYVNTTTAPDSIQLDIKIDGVWSSADTTKVTMSGYTTSTTNYVNIYTTQVARHKGIYSTSYYRLEVNTSGEAFLLTAPNNLRLTGLQIKNTYSTGDQYVNAFREYASSTAHNLIIDSCIFISKGMALRIDSVDWTPASTNVIKNSIAISTSHVACGITGTYGVSNATILYNSNCISQNTNSAVYNLGFYTSTAYNVYAYSTGTTAYSSGISKTNCASSDSSGSAGLTNIPYNTTTFINVTSGSEDFHTVVGSLLRRAGTNLSGTFTNDIVGYTRVAPWDIGAFEVQEHTNDIKNAVVNNATIN